MEHDLERVMNRQCPGLINLCESFDAGAWGKIAFDAREKFLTRSQNIPRTRLQGYFHGIPFRRRISPRSKIYARRSSSRYHRSTPEYPHKMFTTRLRHARTIQVFYLVVQGRPATSTEFLFGSICRRNIPGILAAPSS